MTKTLCCYTLVNTRKNNENELCVMPNIMPLRQIFAQCFMRLQEGILWMQDLTWTVELIWMPLARVSSFSLSSQFLIPSCICPRAKQNITITFINAFGSSRGFLDWCLLCLKALLILHVANQAALEKVSNPSNFFSLSFLCHHDILVLIAWLFFRCGDKEHEAWSKGECQIRHDKGVFSWIYTL